MDARAAVTPGLVGVFMEAMSRLVSGVAVVTTRGCAARPCGLLVSSLCSYSLDPPSVLLAVGRSTRSYGAMVHCASFGVHLLGGGHTRIAEVFAGRGDDKFADVVWDWDGGVPRLAAAPVFLRCVTRRVIPDGDHAILIGDAVDASVHPAEPLVYYRRRLVAWPANQPNSTVR